MLGLCAEKGAPRSDVDPRLDRIQSGQSQNPQSTAELCGRTLMTRERRCAIVAAMSRTNTLVPTKARMTRGEVIALTDAIRSDLDALAQTFWDIGAKLARIKQGAFYEVLGYATFQEYAVGEFRVKLRQVEKMMTIARAYGRTDAVELGIERSAALLAYSRALRPTIDPGELVRSDAVVGERPLSACTVGDILVATEALKASVRATIAARPGSRADARDAKALARAFREYAHSIDLGRAKVTVRGDEVVVRFSRTALKSRLLPG